jgi:hypothetical protein
MAAPKIVGKPMPSIKFQPWRYVVPKLNPLNTYVGSAKTGAGKENA